MFILPKDLDPECLEICKELNNLDGIQTTGSCCGHGRGSFFVYLAWPDFKTWGHKVLTRCTCSRYFKEGWKVRLHHTDTEPFTGFVLIGPKDPTQGDIFAMRIREVLAHPGASRLLGVSSLKKEETYGLK